MHKGITVVIATVLLLLVTISLVGMAFVFLGRTTETATEAGSKQAEQQVQQFGVVPQIVAVDNNIVHLRNVGGTPLTSPTFYVAGRRIDATGPSSLAPGGLGTYVLDVVQMADLPKMSEVKVTTGGFSDTFIAAIKELAALIFKAPVTITGMVIGQDEGIAFQNFAGSTVAVITETGNVGIGTTSPTAKLEVSGDMKMTGRWIVGSAGPWGGDYFEVHRSIWDGTSNNNYGGIAGGHGYFYDGLQSGGNSGGEAANGQLYVSGVSMLMGNVGIGDASPLTKLQIGGDTMGSLPVDTNLYITGNYKSDGSVANRIAMGVDSNAGAVMTISTRSTAGNVYPLFMDFIDGTNPLMTISTTGNVGIGTTTPQVPLDVLGSIVARNIQSPTSGSYIRIGYDSDNDYADILAYDSTAGDYEQLRFRGKTVILNGGGEGNVGIGTTGPGSKLHVASNAGTLNLEGTDHTYIQWFPDGYAAGRKAWTGYGGATSNDFTIANEISGGHIVLSPTSSGNVGIGTTSPAAKLEVAGAVRSNSLSVGSDGGQNRIQGYGGTNPSIRVLNTGDSYANVGAGALSVGLNYGAIAAPSNGMIVEGNVGIGTTGPNFILQAAGSTGIAVRSTGVDGTFQDILTGYYSGNEAEQNAIQTSVSSVADSSGFNFMVSDGGGAATQKQAYRMSRATHRFYIGGTEKVTIDSSGNVGIGTTAPAAKLSVNGNVKIGSAAAQTNKVLCWRSDNTIGYCSSSVDATGACTCNAIS